MTSYLDRAALLLLACGHLLLLCPVRPAVARASDVAHCDWTVHYDEWHPTFANHEYEHNGVLGGANCLRACCLDPTCVGLQLESSLNGQCYKYESKPKGITKAGQPLGDFLVTDGVGLSSLPAWSVFIKTPRAAVPASTASAAHEVALDRSLRDVYGALSPKHAPLHESCDWEVHYDKWIPTFDRRQSEQQQHSQLVGGTSCLNACCQDPSCSGLALESSLNSECYKYATAPSGLDHAGQPLSVFLEGDNVPAWSIFIKRARSSELASASQSAIISPPSSSSLPLSLHPPHHGLLLEAALDKRLRQQAAQEEVLTWDGVIWPAHHQHQHQHQHQHHDEKQNHEQHHGSGFLHGEHHHNSFHHSKHEHNQNQQQHSRPHSWHHYGWQDFLELLGPLHRHHEQQHPYRSWYEWHKQHEKYVRERLENGNASVNVILIFRFGSVGLIAAVLLMLAWRRLQVEARKGKLGELLLLRSGPDPERAGLLPDKQKDAEMCIAR